MKAAMQSALGVTPAGLGKTVSDQKTQALAGSKRARAADRQQEADAEVGDEKLPRKVPWKLWQDAPANASGPPNGPAGDAKREEVQIAAASSDKARAKGSREPHGRAKRGEEPIFIGSRDDTHSKGAKEPRGETKKGLKERKAGAPSQPIRQPPELHVPTHQPKRQKTAPSGNPAEVQASAPTPNKPPGAADAATSQKKSKHAKRSAVAADTAPAVAAAAKEYQDVTEDRVVELAPRTAQHAEAARSGVLGVFAADGRRLKQDPASRSSKARANPRRPTGHQPVKGVAAAQILLQHARPSEGGSDDLPGWDV